MKRLVVLLAVMLLSFGLTNAANQIVVTHSWMGAGNPDTIWQGEPGYWIVSYENDVKLGGVSSGFKMSSPNDATWTLDEAGGFNIALGGGPKFVKGIAGSRWMSGANVDGSCWDLGGTLVSANLAPAQFLIGGAALSGGVTAGALQPMLELHFTAGGITPGDYTTVKTLCIDSGFYPPAGSFIFVPESGPQIIPAYTGGCFPTKISGSAVGESALNVPHTFSLSQNRPNPFNPTTVIDYSLARKSQVDISVFNILGQEVAVLVSAELDAGPHQVVWDGRDANGQQVSSGVYFYKMVTDEFVQTRKMALMR